MSLKDADTLLGLRDIINNHPSVAVQHLHQLVDSVVDLIVGTQVSVSSIVDAAR